MIFACGVPLVQVTLSDFHSFVVSVSSYPWAMAFLACPCVFPAPWLFYGPDLSDCRSSGSTTNDDWNSGSRTGDCRSGHSISSQGTIYGQLHIAEPHDKQGRDHQSQYAHCYVLSESSHQDITFSCEQICFFQEEIWLPPLLLGINRFLQFSQGMFLQLKIHHFQVQTVLATARKLIWRK